jgi:hypothetical protein
MMADRLSGPSGRSRIAAVLAKVLLLIFALVLSLPIVGCGGGKQPPAVRSGTQPDIVSYLRKPGKITHVRYTTYTPPWPTRSEAWIDWDNDRVRSWNVQWTDSPTNPSVCTSIQTGDTWYPCLPSLVKADTLDGGFVNAFWPKIPLRGSDSQLSLVLPSDLSSGQTESSPPTPVEIGTEATTTHESQGDTEIVVRSWKVTSNIELPCEGGETGSASFDYTTTDEGEPISEFINATCGEQRVPYIGVLYHDVEFVDPSALPEDFFDADAARTSLVREQLSSAATQLGTMFWLGEHAGDWRLDGIDQRPGYGTVTYTRVDGGDREDLELTTRSPAIGYLCDNAEPIPDDPYGGHLCINTANDEYVVWNPPGVEVWLEKQSFPHEMSRDDLLALAGMIARWEQRAPGPLLTNEDVRELVADSLELVCPSKLREIRDARSHASFSFDRKSGEWTGVFGSLGEYAVPDAKPVAIPVDERTAVDSTLSHNAAEFADCGADEQPTPEEGDDEFRVKFVSQDSSGFWFELTGVDSAADAAVSFCTLGNGGCRLTDPDGKSVAARGVDIDAVRAQVYRIHWGVDSDELKRAGTWTITVDLGDGDTAKATFDVR